MKKIAGGLIALMILVNYITPRLMVEVNGGILSHKKREVPPTPPSFDRYRLPSGDVDLEIDYRICQGDPLGTIICLHGVRSNKASWYEMAAEINRRGYHFVAPDLRAHGNSSGKYCTYGYYEKEDVSRIIDWLEKNTAMEGPYYVWGRSLGGAIALQSLEADSRIKAGIVESTFSDLRTIIHDYTRQNLGFNNPALTDYFIQRAERLAKFEVDKVIPLNSASHLKQPVLLVHGTKDKKIKLEYGQILANQLQHPKSQFMEISGADHGTVWHYGGDDFVNQVFYFIENI